MKIINYISTISIPLVIMVIIIYGLKEKKNVYDIFIDGVKEGAEIVINLFPTLLAIFIAIGMLRSSGIIELIIKETTSISKIMRLPSEIIPLILVRPISGSASMAVATDIMSTCGVDSLIGKIASTIMGSTETTLYVIAVYTGCIKNKKTRFVLPAALFADAVGIITSVIIWNLIS